MRSYVSRATFTTVIEPNIVSKTSRAQVRPSEARPTGIARPSRLSKKIRYALKVVDGSKTIYPRSIRMTKLSNLAVTMFFLLFAALWNNSAIAQTTKLNVGYSAISGDQLPAWVAKTAGIFQKNGLDVRLGYFTGGRHAHIA